MANVTWLQITLKLTDKPDNFIANKLTEKQGVAGNLATGTLLGGQSTRGMRRTIERLWALISGIASGVYHGNMWMHAYNNAGAVGTGNIACATATASGKTFTFTYGTGTPVTIVFTEGTTGAQGFAKGANATAMALAFATALQAHPILGTQYNFVPNVGNIAVTSKLPGNGLWVMSTNDGTAFVITALTGGTIGVPSLAPQHFPANKLP